MATIINNPSGPSAPSTSGEGEGLSTGILVGIILVIVIALLLIFGLPALRGDNTNIGNTPPQTGTGGPANPTPDNTPNSNTNVEGDLDVNLY